MLSTYTKLVEKEIVCRTELIDEKTWFEGRQERVERLSRIFLGGVFVLSKCWLIGKTLN